MTEPLSMHPLFIGGYPRSGTTLLGAMVGAHSSCICTPESQFKTRVLRHPSLEGISKPDVQTAFNIIRKDWRFRLWGISTGLDFVENVSSYPDLVLSFVRVFAEKNDKPNAAIWVDHTPSNIKKENVLTLLELFPDAKFVHIIRDGRAVAASIMPLDWGANTIDKAAMDWLKRVTGYLAMESELGDQRVMRIHYENLVREPGRTMKDMCTFLDIEFHSAMEKGEGFHVPDYTANQHTLVGSVPDAGQIDAWKKRLTARQTEIFESIAGGLLASLGYQLLYGSRQKKMKLIEKMISGVQEVYRGQIVNVLRHRRRMKKGVAALNKEK